MLTGTDRNNRIVMSPLGARYSRGLSGILNKARNTALKTKIPAVIQMAQSILA